MAHQRQKHRVGDLNHRAHKPQRISPASYERYTVAWICALPKEMVAAKTVLDEVHKSLPRRKNDTNSYVLGGIGCHNIVIACLPTNDYGTNNAVNVLTNLTRTFESIHFCLMVGIGGGVPRPNFDIRLGDIIVGTRVVQHDLGKIVESGQIQHTAVPKPLAHLLGKALALLRAEHQPHSSRVPLILEDKFKDLPAYAHPTTADRLFSSEYAHSSRASNCDKCSPSALVKRSDRGINVPYIHYGTIASGNQVMKNSKARDKVAEAVDAICFEMEAAGLNDICPCLSIRGICDYSDSHKSKEWQEYAAATAAAFAREFLERLPQTEDILAGSLEREYWLQNDKYNQCLRNLRETDPRDDKTRIQETKGGLLEDAYRWVLENDQFKEWHNASNSQLLWIKGDPGKGKTMLLCGLIDELETEHGSLLSYFFCQATEARLSNATAVLRGLLYLLLVQEPQLFSYIEERYDHSGKQLFEDGNAWQALSKIFMDMLEDPILDGALLIVDALDECSKDQERLLDFIVRCSNVKWIVSSRNWPEIEQWLDRSSQKVRLHLELNQDSVCKAVGAFIEYKVEQLAKRKQYDAKLKSDVKSYLAKNADGTFLWVALVCQELADSKVFRKRHTRLSLKFFPKGLDPLYGRMMEYISSSLDAATCRHILALASAVYRPVTLVELKTLLGSHYEDDDDDLPGVIGGCGSFLTLRGDTIYFLHQSAKDFLLDKASDQILPLGLAYQHELMFKISLEALAQTLRRDICQLDHPGFDINDILPDVLEPLEPVRYSCIYWVDHLHDSGPTSSSNILDNGGSIHVFIQKGYLYWLESLGLLRSTGEGIKAMYKLEDLANRLEAPESVRKLLLDARRFILTHKRPIEIAPLQVYASGLVFSPEESHIRELFKHEEPDWIDPKPKMEKNWNNCLQTLEAHGDAVKSLVLSPDNHLLASIGRDMTVKIWDITTGLCRLALEDRNEEIISITFLPDGHSLATASNTIKIWNMETGLCLRTLEGHDKPVWSLASSSDGQYLASGSMDRTIKVWSLKTGTCLRTLEGHPHEVFSVTFSPDNQRLVSGSLDCTVKIWDMKSFSCLQTLRVDYGPVTLQALSPDGRRLASIAGSPHQRIEVCDVATGPSLPILQIPVGFETAIAFSADGKHLAFGDGDSDIKLTEVGTGKVLRTLKGIGGEATSIALTADCQCLVSGSRDGLVKIWAVPIDVCPSMVERHKRQVTSVAVSADGLRVASKSIGATVKVWDTETGSCLRTLECHGKVISSVALSADSKRLAICSLDGAIEVWDIITGTCLHTLKENAKLYSVAFSTDGNYLATGASVNLLASSASENAAKIWDTVTGKCLHIFPHDYQASSVAFSPDNRCLALGSNNDLMIWIWNAREHIFKSLEANFYTTSVAFSVDSQYLASGSYDGTVSIWDLEQCISLQTIDLGTNPYYLSFDLWTNSRLYTDIGILELKVPNPMPDANAKSLRATSVSNSDWSSHGINISGVWITKHGEKVLWLPPEYRPERSAVFRSTVAIGCHSGRVLIMRFS